MAKSPFGRAVAAVCHELVEAETWLSALGGNEAFEALRMGGEKSTWWFDHHRRFLPQFMDKLLMQEEVIHDESLWEPLLRMRAQVAYAEGKIPNL